MAGEAQAMLLNFENLLVAQFGEDAALGDRLAVPLQLSGFRNDGSLRSLRKAQAQLPADVSNFLAGHRTGVDDDVLTSPEYCLRIFFIPVTANRERSADAVVRFVPPDKVTPALEKQLGPARNCRVPWTVRACCFRRQSAAKVVPRREPRPRPRHDSSSSGGTSTGSTTTIPTAENNWGTLRGDASGVHDTKQSGCAGREPATPRTGLELWRGSLQPRRRQAPTSWVRRQQNRQALLLA